LRSVPRDQTDPQRLVELGELLEVGSERLEQRDGVLDQIWIEGVLRIVHGGL
jgi:hypothetical protein